ncbi:MAG TPA: M42 family metallopeptidase [Clostridia bacterium]|nr:M42 family metallopeptidase [Clostridia bacterium]
MTTEPPRRDASLEEVVKNLSDAAGISGYEAEVRQILRGYLEPYTSVERDNLGSLVTRKGGEGGRDKPKIMLAAHMDEIGFMVTRITPEGHLRFQTIGGWWDNVLLAQRVVIKTKSGDVPGVIGSKPPHILEEEERKKVIPSKDMFIDIGATSEAMAKEAGVRPGDPVVPWSPFSAMKQASVFQGKAFDDRLGCAGLVEVVRQLGNEKHPNIVFAVGTVQEEVGTRGAATSAWVVNPDVAVILEVGIAQDVPGMKESEIELHMGQGPALFLYDATMIPNLKLRDLFIDTAEKLGIPLQFSAMPRGGTDGGKIHVHTSGVPSVVLGVPVRYIHSHTGIFHMDDLRNMVRLVIGAIERLDAKTVQSVIEA